MSSQKQWLRLMGLCAVIGVCLLLSVSAPMSVVAQGPSPFKIGTEQLLGPVLSPPLSSLSPSSAVQQPFNRAPLPRHPRASQAVVDDSDSHVAPSSPALAATMPITTIAFDGIDNVGSTCACLPPDTNGDVGPNHYIQAVNNAMRVFNKAGTPLTAIIQLNALFAPMGAGTPCGNNQNQGDPVTFYDPVSDRWVISDFAFGLSGSQPIPPFYECIAVSTTSNAAGAYWLYAFQHTSAHANWLGDYPKFGVWSDGWYMTVNLFCEDTGSSCDPFGGVSAFQGVRVFAFNRTTMIAGGSSTLPVADLTLAMLGDSYSLVPATYRFGGPPAGRDEFLLSIDSPAAAGTTLNKVHVWRFHPNFVTPASSIFTGTTDVTVANFVDAFHAVTGTNLVPQSGTAVKLDTLGDRVMANAWYQRDASGVERLFAAHTINDTTPTAIRWYEFNVTGGAIPSTPTQQQSFNNSADGLYRWMPSLAVDWSGNLAIGYSASSSSTFASMRYAGRLKGDAANSLAQGEATMFAGGGRQTHSSGRWGDYSGMSVDPTDRCSFWHTNEYYKVSSSSGWATGIGAFKFPHPSCIDLTQLTLKSFLPLIM